jgi:hypothetical protein
MRMIKLYNTDETVRYWEAWATPSEVTIHWGILGEIGETREIPISAGDNPKAIIEREAKKPKKDGFRKLPKSKLQKLVIQYPIDGMGDSRVLDRRIKVEELMNESLGWRGLGHCDGGDIGTGTVNVFCFVVDAKVAAPHIVEELKANELLQGAVIAVGEKPSIVWPKDFKGHFEI